MVTYNFITGEFFRDGVKLRLGKTGRGYPRVWYEGRDWLAHRLAFHLMGENVPELVDHANGLPACSQWCNLREATNQQNQQNAKVRRTGLKGASYDKAVCKWKAAIRHNGRLINLGRFATEQEAHDKYCAAAKELAGAFARFA